MNIDLDKLLIGTGTIKTIYNKQLGMLSIKGYPERVTLTHYGGEITVNSEWNGNSKTGEFSFNDIFVVTVKEVALESGRRTTELNYEQFSFNSVLNERAIFAVKIKNKYHRIISGIDFYNVSLLNPADLSDSLGFLGQRLQAQMQVNKKCNIQIAGLKGILERFEWKEENDNKLIPSNNINDFKPQTKVFIDAENCGEGKIIKLKEFSSFECKAIYEVELYNGTHIDVNWYDKTIKMLVPKSYEAPNELDILEEILSENKLNPFVRGISNGFNIYWQAVEEAASYTVELYTWNDASAADKLYKIADKTIERNQYYAVFDLLAEGKYFVRIIAEDRTGLKIAVNKAISVDVKKDKPTVVNSDRRGFVVG